jgi:hypothetical protein
MNRFDFHRFHFNFMMGATPESQTAEDTAKEKDTDRLQDSPPVT